MLLLSVDSSAKTASAALTRDGEVLAYRLINKGLTHSETLLPLIEEVMQGRGYNELSAIAITAGPGSFTGVRIGVATVKGIAFVHGTPCIPVSTLEAVAHNFVNENAVICAVMDARRMQFYNAIFRSENGRITRLCEDRAIALSDLEAELADYSGVIVAGDGAELFMQNTTLKNCELPQGDSQYQNGVGVARAAEKINSVPASRLMPVYLRQSQAERELKLKK